MRLGVPAVHRVFTKVLNIMVANTSYLRGQSARLLACLLMATAAISIHGCNHAPPKSQPIVHASHKVFILNTLTPAQAKVIVTSLSLGIVSLPPEPNAIDVAGSPNDLRKVATVLDLADVNDPYVVETLAPASLVRTLPSNDQIAKALGNMAIGTFAIPPQSGEGMRGIVDVHGDAVVAVVPARCYQDLVAFVRSHSEDIARLKIDNQSHASGAVSETPEAEHRSDRVDQRKAITAPLDKSGPETSSVQPRAEAVTRGAKPNTPEAPSGASIPSLPYPVVSTSGLPGQVLDNDGNGTAGTPTTGESGPQQTDANVTRGVLKPSRKVYRPPVAGEVPAGVSLENGDEVLELSLPEKIELKQLIELTGEYLHLDCMYDADKIGNQVVTLNLHSKLRSEMKVKDLYSLLQTILKFRGLAMTRQQGNLVMIVPAAEALDIDPELIDPNDRTLQVGNVIVTRIFEPQHVDVSSIANLLQTMRLSVAVSPIAETQTLFVTCYAHRISRIEQLVNMIDRPGRPREYRFRQLKYTMAATLARKVLSLAGELEDIPISIAPSEKGPPGAAPRAPQRSSESQNIRSATSPAVYLDTDERTNRVLMIGFGEQLETVEALIDSLDVPQQDLRMLKVYDFKRVEASAAVKKLQELGVIGKTTRAAPGAKAQAASTSGSIDEAPGEEPQVVLLEATNSLLVNATEQQHGQIRTVISYIDVSLEDSRTMKVYHLEHMEVQGVVEKLEQMGITGSASRSTARTSKISQPGAAPSPTPAAGDIADAITADYPQVIVLETMNSLLVNATLRQHERIEAVIKHIDIEAPKETIPYEIYFLENQDPNRLAEVLGKLVQETIKNPEGKIEKTVQKTDEPVTIIPDPGTFSLIVYASRKNQNWIGELIQKLDKRRPQVLIDVTLVEITETEAFNYDLNLIKSFPDLTATSGLTGNITSGQNPVTSDDIIDKLNATGKDQFIDTQSASGNFTAFYGDRHINALLQAMQSKNYGRILAKPKILVNDNQPGTIKTADTTYVAKRSSVPVSTGGAGTDATLIETAVEYESYEAGITLDITPHISVGDLLRLDIELIRSDFRETEDPEKPPNTTTSELKTTVFTPDGSTIILGGLLKLNQNKGGTKVPILGDIPLIGILFRSVNNRDNQNKLYIFVKAEIIRPASMLAQGATELESISQKNREAFEKHELEFQNYQNWPGMRPRPVEPAKVLDAR